MSDAKDIQVQYNAGGYNTLPGNTGDLSRESSSGDDTIFGQHFTSSQPSLISWALSGNAFYKGLPGYIATVKKSGTSTPFTGEAMSQVDATQRWKVDAAVKSVWNFAVTATIFDGVTEVAVADILAIDYIFGEVEFVAGFTPSGAITADGEYYPTVAIAKAQNFDLGQTADTEDNTDFDTAQANNGHSVFRATQLTAELGLSGFYNQAQVIRDLQLARDSVVIEVNPDGASKSLLRGIFKVNSDSLSGDAGSTEAEELSFSLSVPEGAGLPFGWRHAADTTLSKPVQDIIASWSDRAEIDLKYFPTGSANPGFSGVAVTTDVSLSGSVDGLNEFSVGFQGSGELTDIP